MQPIEKNSTQNNQATVISIGSKDPNGIRVSLSNWGASLLKLFAPDRNGVFEDVVQGPKSIEHLKNDPFYMGRSVGRFANRIAGGTFTVDGKQYHLDQNNGPNHLHGGIQGVHNVSWDVSHHNETTAVFALVCENGSDGYPGQLKISVRYAVTSPSCLEVEYIAETTQKTPVNIVQHVYWNLTGNAATSISEHSLHSVQATHYLPVDENAIPTGKIASVEGTVFDFTTPNKLHAGLNCNDEQIQMMHGYDHCLVFSDQVANNAEHAIIMKDSQSGRKMRVSTNMPGVQIYTGNFLDGSVLGDSNQSIDKHSGVCLETQHYPDSPNQQHFPNPFIAVGEPYRSITRYSFEHD